MSIAIAELMATILSFWAMTNGSFTYSVGWNSTKGLLSRKSNVFFEPRTKEEMILPLWRVFASPVTTPLSNSSTTPSENISVWMPRSRFSFRNRSTASGISPIPICRVEPFSMRSATFFPIARATSPTWVTIGSSTSGRSISTTVGEPRGVDEGVPQRPGHPPVDERDHRPGGLGRGLRALDPDPVGAEPVLVGRRDVDEGHVDRDHARADEAGDLGQEDRHPVGPALVDRLPDVAPGEEGPVAEGARSTWGRRGRRPRRSAGA